MISLLAIRQNTTKIVNQFTKTSSSGQFLLFSSSARLQSQDNHKDNHKYIIRSKHKDVATVAGVSVPELIWSNLGKWENLPAFVRRTH